MWYDTPPSGAAGVGLETWVRAVGLEEHPRLVEGAPQPRRVGRDVAGAVVQAGEGRPVAAPDRFDDLPRRSAALAEGEEAAHVRAFGGLEGVVELTRRLVAERPEVEAHDLRPAVAGALQGDVVAGQTARQIEGVVLLRLAGVTGDEGLGRAPAVGVPLPGR